jgi:hypothetical protein
MDGTQPGHSCRGRDVSANLPVRNSPVGIGENPKTLGPPLATLRSLPTNSGANRMDVKKVNDLLQEIALAHGAAKPDRAIQNIALALMHIAASLDHLEKEIGVVRFRLPPAISR